MVFVEFFEPVDACVHSLSTAFRHEASGSRRL